MEVSDCRGCTYKSTYRSITFPKHPQEKCDNVERREKAQLIPLFSVEVFHQLTGMGPSRTPAGPLPPGFGLFPVEVPLLVPV